MIPRKLEKAWRHLGAFALFIRFSFLAFTAILPFLGAASVVRELTSQQIAALIGVAFTFHIYVYVLNDVIDLAIDRTQMLRVGSPLIEGAIQPWHALTFALLQIPLAFSLTAWLRADILAYASLCAAFVLLAIYNAWGKRSRFPPLTDLVQGLGWAALLLYGATIVSDHPTWLTGILFTFVIVFIMLINGVHGGLRDLANDLSHNTRTTAILLGVQPAEVGKLSIPARFKLYAMILQGSLAILVILPLIYNPLEYGAVTRGITTGIILVLVTLALILPVIAIGSFDNLPMAFFVGLLHVICWLSALLALFLFYPGQGLRIAMLTVFFAPLLRAFSISMPMLKYRTRKVKAR